MTPHCWRSAIRARPRELIGADSSAEERHLVVGLIRSFTTAGPQLVAPLADVLHAGDQEAAGARAHRLGGAAATLALDPLARLCTGLEEWARTGHPTNGTDQVPDLIDAATELDRGLDLLADLIHELDPDRPSTPITGEPPAVAPEDR